MFTLPQLPYPPHALEPHLDAMTMEIHHDKHHATYVKNLNDLLPDKSDSDLENILGHLDRLDETIRQKVRNHGGGHWNHSFFWPLLTPQITEPSPGLAKAIDASFGSLPNFKDRFSAAALNHFGSGWAWLVKQGEDLQIVTTANQDNPLMDGKKAILGLDVWEHAYYLKYQNRRADYIAAFWHVLNWQQVSDNFLRL